MWVDMVEFTQFEEDCRLFYLVCFQHRTALLKNEAWILAQVPADQSREMEKNGLEGKFYKEEGEQVWSAMKEIVPRISVEYNIIRLEEVLLESSNPVSQYWKWLYRTVNFIKG